MSDDVWQALEGALSHRKAKAFEKLCRRYEASLRADFPARYIAPPEIGRDPAAAQRYAKVTMAVAEQLGIDYTDPLGSPSEGLQRSLEESDALGAEGEHEAALAVLVNLLDTGALLSEPVIGHALCYGRMGTLALYLDRGMDAWQWTTKAQELCHRLGDADGCLNYIANLHFIAEATDAHADAMAAAGMAVGHIQEYGPTRLLPRWLANYTEAMRQAEGPGQVREFAAAAARYAREIVGDDPDELSFALNGLAITLHRISDDAAARPLLEEAVRARRAAELNDAVLGAMLGNLGKILAGADDEQAEPMLLEAIEYLAAGGDDYHKARSAEARSNLAALYHHRGDHAAARAIYTDLVESGEASQIGLRNFADLERQLSNPARQLMLYNLAREARAESDMAADDDAAAFEQLLVQVDAEHELGNDQQAVQLLFQADELARQMPHPALRRAMVVVMLAECGHPVKERELTRALDAARADPECEPSLLRSMESNVGMWYIRQERPTDALVHLDRAVAGVDPHTADRRQLNAFNRIALAYHHLRETARAEELYRLVLARRRELLPAADPAVAQSLFNLGSLRLEVGGADAAALLQEQFDLEDTHLLEVFGASSEDQRLDVCPPAAELP